MGFSTCTLHVSGVDRAAVETLLPEGFLLREGNPPWIGVIPAEAPPEDARAQLERLAKALTKDKGGAAALLFDYFDDELFECRFLQNGRSRASCRSDGSWAKLCKQLGAFFGDELPQKASRFAALRRSPGTDRAFGTDCRGSPAGRRRSRIPQGPPRRRRDTENQSPRGRPAK